MRSEAVEKPLPNPVTGVEVGMAGGAGGAAAAAAGSAGAGDRVQLTAVDPGRFEGLVSSTPTGDWTAEIVVHREGAPDSVQRPLDHRVVECGDPRSSSPAAVPRSSSSSLTGAGLAFGLRRRRDMAGTGPASRAPSDASPAAGSDAMPDSVPALEEVGGP